MITPKQLARMLQNRSTAIKAAEHVSALQDALDESGGGATCFYVSDNDGGTLRVLVTQYKQPLR